MKYIYLLLMIAGFTITTNAFAQDRRGDDTLPYMKYPTLPAFKILEMDSSTVFNTYNIPEGKYTILMLFSPDCEHCQKMTEKLIAGMDSLKQIQFYMMTPVSDMSELRKFYKKYHLADYKNIVEVGRDYEFFYFNFYGAKFVPYLALYDKHKKLVKAFPNGVTIKELYELTRG